MVKLHSYGKINLFLNVEGIRENGYHDISSVMQSIDLHDDVIIEEAPADEIIIECNDNSIPRDSRNTCYKAAAIIKDAYSVKSGVKIHIHKNIPAEAGLAGGSSNSAAVIMGLNKLWGLEMTLSQMQEAGLKVGADVPFCLEGGTCLARGIGEKLVRLEDFVWNNILVVKPEFSMSTASVYKSLSPGLYNLYDYGAITSAINERRYKAVSPYMANTLERVVEKAHPEINTIKEIMMQNGSCGCLMTGSGSAVYGLFPDGDSISHAYNSLNKSFVTLYKTKTVSEGTEFYV